MSNHEPRAAPRCRPAAPYFGGKARVADLICARIAAVRHSTYVEPFVGLGGVFLRRAGRARSEVVNDANGEVANLFRVIQRHCGWLSEAMAHQITSRAEFDRLLAVDPATLTDVERAVRFLYLQRMAYGGKIINRSFAVRKGRPGHMNPARIRPVIEAIHRRLADVIVENVDWSVAIDRYDGPETLFYLDPPYWGCEKEYERRFPRERFEELASRLGGIAGRFLLSINDRPETRALFASFEIEETEVMYSVQGGRRRPYPELIVSGGGAR